MKFQFIGKTKLKVIKQTVEGTKRDSAILSVQYENGAEVVWIFNGKVLSNTDENENKEWFSFDTYEANGMVQQDLLIDVLLDSYQGIYTIQVSKDGCTAIDTIYLSVVNPEL